MIRKLLAAFCGILILLHGVDITARDHAAVYGSEYTWLYRCNRNAEKRIALTFDDGPHPRLTPIILDILKEYHVTATFFLVGENVDYYPKIVNRIYNEGHEIGNHTYSHVKSSQVDPHCLEEEILNCESSIGGIVDIRPRVFRPPQGDIEENLGCICNALGYLVVLWSIDTRDWCHIPSAEIAETVIKTVRGGDIILMHDYIGHDSPTPDALKKIIPALLEQGYEFVSISELLNCRGASDQKSE